MPAHCPRDPRQGLKLSALLVILILVAAGGARALDLPAARETVGWDGRGKGGERVPAGVYFARVRDADTESSARIVVLR